MHTPLLSSLVLTTLCIGAHSPWASANNTSSLTNITINPHQQSIEWGSESNGLAAGIFIQPNPEALPPPYVLWIQVRGSADAEGITTTRLPHNSTFPPYMPGTQLFMPTNSLWGPMELIDPKGNRVIPTLDSLNDQRCYPPSFQLRVVRRLLPAEASYSGPPLPLPIRINVARSFRLNDYFRTKRAGEYRLTVWPKVYKRLAPNSDTCVRNDLPPVTVLLRLGGEEANR